MLKGTSNTGVTWSAALGTISSSGLYTAPTVNNQTVDTVSAVSVIDPSKYATATVVVRGGVGGPFTITNQQPISMVPNASSLFGKRLPADVMSHLYPNSDTIAQQMLAASKPPNGNFTGMIWAHAGHSNDIDGIPTYYGQASDPAYVITGGNSPSGPHNAINVPFHAPIGAQTSGATSEQYFTVWDQTQNIVISFYTCCGNGTQILPNCTSTSLSNPCPIGINPADSMVTTLSDPQPYGIGAGNPWSSSSIFAPNGEIRVQELIQGHIYHPVVMNVLCQAAMNSGSQVGAAVFPNTTGYGAGSCNYICPPGAGCTNVSNPPSAGMLVFLDYSDSDLAQLQGYLPPWQYPIIEALSHYGGYIGDTGNALHPSRLENDSAYATARVTNPLWSWIQGQPGTNSGCGPNGDCVLYWNQYNGTYGSCPASSTPNLCDVSAHLHVADPCVAKGLAGITAAQGACF